MCPSARHEEILVWQSGGTAALILNLGIRWRWVVSCTPGRNKS
jgi:hypothetical protein